MDLKARCCSHTCRVTALRQRCMHTAAVTRTVRQEGHFEEWSPARWKQGRQNLQRDHGMPVSQSVLIMRLKQRIRA